MTIKRGARVRQIVSPITGTVAERRLHGEADEIECLVTWTDDGGAEQSRWFLESQIEAIAEEGSK